MRTLYRILGLLGTVKAAQRGPAALARRYVRQQVNRHGNHVLRRVLRP